MILKTIKEEREREWEWKREREKEGDNERERKHTSTNFAYQLMEKDQFHTIKFFHARNFLYSLDFKYKTVEEKFILFWLYK